MPVKEKKMNILVIWINAHLALVAAGLVIILLVAGYLIVLGPKWRVNEDQPEFSLTRVQQELDNQQAKLQQLENLIKEYKSLPAAHFTKVAEFLPADNDAPILFTHLDAIAKVNDSALLNVAVAEVSDRELIEQRVREGLNLPNNIKVVNLTADFLVPPGSGGYPFFEDLITSVENNLRLLDIEYINFSPLLTSITVNAKTYYLEK